MGNGKSRRKPFGAARAWCLERIPERDKEKISCKLAVGFFMLAGEGDFN